MLLQQQMSSEQPVMAEPPKSTEKSKIEARKQQAIINRSQKLSELENRKSPNPQRTLQEAFKPQISKKSQQMAEQKRQGQKIEDHLILEGKKLKEKLAKMEYDDH